MSRDIAAKILAQGDLNKVWTNNYAPVFPLVLQDVSIGAVLPAVLYMLRWGHRRGAGKFIKTFATGIDRDDPNIQGEGQRKNKATVATVAKVLSSKPGFSGFDHPSGRSILGDLLLSHLIENKKNSRSHEESIQRVVSDHYFSSWVDLPESVAHLRGIPEFIISVLAWQQWGDQIQRGEKKHRVKIGSGVSESQFLSIFGKGVVHRGDRLEDLASDQFDESVKLAVDQLLCVRLALACEQAPVKAKGKGEASPIPNQRPLATIAAHVFHEDITTFVFCYGRTMPRAAFIAMLETGLSINLINIFLSTVLLLEQWSRNYSLPPFGTEIRSYPVFVDMAQSSDKDIRGVAERSVEGVRRSLDTVPRTLMYMRLIETELASSDIPTSALPKKAPDSTEWVRFLGDIAAGSHAESGQFERVFRKYVVRLKEVLDDEKSRPDVREVLEEDGRKAGERLAEALVLLMGHKNTTDNINKFFADVMMTDQFNGVARRRRASGKMKHQEILSFSFSNMALEFLVHRHLRRCTKGWRARTLSLPEFIDLLRERYGFFVDRSPPGMDVANELLHRNRQHLERRLRDLGLLQGVNDAERMKRLQSRFDAVEEPLPDACATGERTAPE